MLSLSNPGERLSVRKAQHSCIVTFLSRAAFWGCRALLGVGGTKLHAAASAFMPSACAKQVFFSPLIFYPQSAPWDVSDSLIISRAPRAILMCSLSGFGTYSVLMTHGHCSLSLSYAVTTEFQMLPLDLTLWGLAKLQKASPAFRYQCR